MPHFNTNTITRAFCRYLDRDRQTYTQQSVIRTEYPLGGELGDIWLEMRIGDDGYNVYSFIPEYADPRKPAQLYRIAKFISMINWDLQDGCFELNHRSGEIRFRCFRNCENIDRLADYVIRQSIVTPLEMLEHYGEGFLMILRHDATAEEAYDVCRAAIKEEKAPRRPVRRRSSFHSFHYEDDEEEIEEEDDFPAGFKMPGFEEDEYPFADFEEELFRHPKPADENVAEADRADKESGKDEEAQDPECQFTVRI